MLSSVAMLPPEIWPYLIWEGHAYQGVHDKLTLWVAGKTSHKAPNMHPHCNRPIPVVASAVITPPSIGRHAVRSDMTLLPTSQDNYDFPLFSPTPVKVRHHEGAPSLVPKPCLARESPRAELGLPFVPSGASPLWVDFNA
jgi:hypothetical protein